MAQSLFSNSWYRVAGLRPRLRNHAQIHRHVYRGSVWYVLQNHSTGKFHRFTPLANRLIGLMDGKRTLQDIWDLASIRLGDEMPAQDEVIKLMADLHRADVLQSDAPPDTQELDRRRQNHARQRWKQYIGNPLSLRFPLFDPDRALTALMPLLRPLLGRWGAALWLLLVGWALVLVMMHWSSLSSDVVDRVFSVENLLLVVVVFPLIKLVHEFGHAVATRVGGGEVHETGVMLLVMMPIPYVDATSATAFRDKRSRMLVGAAGMMAELLIAAFAVFAWVNLDPGIERAIAYNILLVAGLTTLLFNANPLLRYDGYYILADFLEMPNLGQRANEYLGYLVNRHLYGVTDQPPPAGDARERHWLLAYGVGSFIFRMFMMVSIVLVVASQFFFIGVLLALWALFTMLVLPLAKKFDYLVSGTRLASHRQRALLTTGGLALLVLALLLWLPAPTSTRTEGVIWAAERSQIRAAVDGFVASVAATPGQSVGEGELLIQGEDAELQMRTQALRAQLAELEARYDEVLSTSRVQAEVLNEQKSHLAAALDLALARQAQLQIRAPFAGTFVMQDAANAVGRFTPRGEVLAYVIDNAAAASSTVRVVVAQSDGDLVSRRTRWVEIRPAHRLARPVTARILRQVPAATDELPSMTLSLQGGGRIGLDPNRPGDGKSLEKLFVLDIELPPGEEMSYIGERIHVHFELEREPLANQWYREVRRVFLKKFNV
jgi:putative peptide zinc metalloprotease protein